MSKRICKHCHRIVDMYNHDCSVLKRIKYINKKRFDKNDSKTTKQLRTKKWNTFRKSILLRDNSMCQRCKNLLNMNTYDNLEIHHIKPRQKYPELMFDENNVVTLCKQCNDHLGLNGIDFNFTPKNVYEPTI